MSYRETSLRTWTDNHLFSALLELTYACNLDCFFCYNDLNLKGRSLRLPHYERLLDELAELHCLHLTLSGGEPLAHPEFFAIGGHARERGFVVRIKSNGHALRGSLLKRVIEDVDPYMVEVSLHGATPETHDRQTRVAGSFARLLGNLEEMKAAGVRTRINATLTRWNEDEIEEMFAIADRLDVTLTMDPEVTPRDDGDTSPLSVAPTPGGIRRLVDVQRRRVQPVEVRREGDTELMSGSADKHCGAGSSGIAVDPFGNVYPCVQWRRSIGNLHESSLVALWTERNDELARIRELTVEAKGVVAQQGELTPFLQFCPGAAELATGSPIQISADVSERAQIRLHAETSEP